MIKLNLYLTNSTALNASLNIASITKTRNQEHFISNKVWYLIFYTSADFLFFFNKQCIMDLLKHIEDESQMKNHIETFNLT